MSSALRRPAVRVTLFIAIAVAVLLVALVLLLAFFDLNRLRAPIAQRLSERFDRPVHIEGNLRGNLLSAQPTVTVSGLKLGNPHWAGRGDMALIERATIKVRLLPLLRGNVQLVRLQVMGGEVNLFRDASGRSNWALIPPRPEARGEPAEFPVIHHVAVDNVRVKLIDQQRKLEFQGMLSASEQNSDERTRPFQINADGELNGEPFTARVRGGSLAEVRRSKPYPFEFDMTAANTRLVANGVIAQPFKFGSARADFTLSGYDMSNLYYFTGLATPQTPPYRVKSKYSRDGKQIRLHDLTGTVGDSDLHGDITIDLSGERPRMIATLASNALDLDDLGVLLGAPPTIKEGETASPEQVRLGREMAARHRVFPDKTLEFDRMRQMDATATLTAGTITARKIPLKQFSVRVQLERGQLVVDPIRFDFPQGRLAGYAWVDTTKEVPETYADIRLSGVRLGQFKPRNSKQPPLEGTLHGRALLRGSGRSMHDIVSSANGSLTLVLPKGEVREAFAELTGINVSRGLGLLLAKDEERTGVRCGFADFRMKNGTLTTESLVFDTDDVLILGKGEVRLGPEQFDLIVQGRPKKLRLFRVKAPIAIRGALRRPDIGIDAGNALTQSGLAAALSALAAPLAAIIAFVDPGLEKDADCSALMAQAKQEGAIRSAASVKAAQEAEPRRRR